MLITIEGIDGAGKTTAANIVRQHLGKRLGVAPLITSELNHTSVGQDIKKLINLSVDRHTELYLILAARSHHINTVLLPELDSGCWVIMDRYIHSTLAYQAGGRLFEKQEILTAHMGLERLPIPDLVIYLDVTPETARQRLLNRGKLSSMDSLGAGFYDRARSMYTETIRKVLSRDAVILNTEDGTQDQQRARLEGIIDTFLDRRGVSSVVNGKSPQGAVNN